MTRTSVTVPNWPKYSLSLSGVVCQDSPPTKSFPGDESEEERERVKIYKCTIYKPDICRISVEI